VPTAADVDIAFGCKRVRDLWDELLPLMARHHAERGDLPPLDVDTVQYEVLDALQRIRVFTARAGGVLVGYASFVLAAHLHHRTQRRAVHDVVYVVPEHRSMTSLQLLLYADRALRAEGVEEIVQVAPTDGAFGMVLERLGYRAAEITYLKRHSRAEG